MIAAAQAMRAVGGEVWVADETARREFPPLRAGWSRRGEPAVVLIWDNAPPHHPHRVREAAQAHGMAFAFLPFRSPELMPLEDLWRGLKATVAANRCYPSLDELTQRALMWLDDLSDADRLRRCGFEASKFDWLPTYIRKVIGHDAPCDR